MSQSHLRTAAIALLFILAGALFIRDIRPAKPVAGFDFPGFAQLPVQEGGRIKPFDTVARTTLMMLSGRQSLRDDYGRRIQASEWFAELILNPRAAADRNVFRIDHPDLVGLLGFHNEDRKYFSMVEIAAHFESLNEQFATIPAEAALRDSFQRALAELQGRIALFDRMAFTVLPPVFFGDALQAYGMLQQIHADSQSIEPGTERHATVQNAYRLFAGQFAQMAAASTVQPFPPRSGELPTDWRPLGSRLLETLDDGGLDPVVERFAHLSQALIQRDASRFNATLGELQAAYAARADERAAKTGFEFFFNSFAPFYYAMEIYVLVFLVAALSWLGWGRSLASAALWLLFIGFLVHSFGMGARIYLQARPPVTNLYSSAIFVSWAAIPICLWLERRHRNGIASAAAAILGFCTLIIAHHLSFSGDTMEMMRAVLDSNFWLATHVPTVTIGYSATFLAGLIGAIYILRTVVSGKMDGATEKSIEAMVYGIVCFALLFSFVGTVLGGIWADQSWGRFWGWDPKENGALMIVLWNAVMLHARWAKIGSVMTLMQMAVVGNIVTAWSWFGTNMLGVGLHSYGFMDAAFFGLIVFIASQVLLILLGALAGVSPRRRRTESAAAAQAPSPQ